jgi:CheY-like chemotaxis protein
MVSIFIVEDDESLLNLYKKALSLNGHNVVACAKDGEEAINTYKNLDKKPDIILMDHRMPVKSGLEAAREILAIDDDVNIIFASADKSVKEEALSLGIKSFKDKPFTLDRLFKNIEKAINSS